MSSPSHDEIRNKVDLLSHTIKSDDTLQSEIKENLIEFLRSRGLLEQKYTKVSFPDPETAHGAGSVHMCPWGTCQATRHGSNK